MQAVLDVGEEGGRRGAAVEFAGSGWAGGQGGHPHCVYGGVFFRGGGGLVGVGVWVLRG